MNNLVSKTSSNCFILYSSFSACFLSSNSFLSLYSFSAFCFILNFLISSPSILLISFRLLSGYFFETNLANLKALFNFALALLDNSFLLLFSSNNFFLFLSKFASIINSISFIFTLSICSKSKIFNIVFNLFSINDFIVASP